MNDPAPVLEEPGAANLYFFVSADQLLTLRSVRPEYSDIDRYLK